MENNTNKKLSTSASRRKFIKSLGIAGAAFTIVPRSVLGGNGFVAPSDTLYIAGIGAGGKENRISPILPKAPM